MATSHRTTTSFPRLSSADPGLALLVALAAFVAYLRTLSPLVLASDSAEFQVLAYQVGIAHTPGYPLYILLAKLLTFLPVGTVAYRVNLFSACMAALAVAGVYLAARLLAGSRLAALVAALAFASSFTFWSQAVIAEVYTSGAAFQAAVLVCVFGWYRSGTRWLLVAAGLLGGLSLGIHSTVALLAPAVLLVLLLCRERVRGAWLPAALAVLAGVAVFVVAFLLVDANNAPASMFNAAYAPAHSAWGLTEADLNNPLERMLFVASATQWRGAFFGNLRGLPARLGEFALSLPRDLSMASLLLGLAGAVLLVLREWRLAAFVALALVCQAVFAFTYQIGDYYLFYIGMYLLGLLLAAYAIGAALSWLGSRPARWVPLAQAGIALLACGAMVWPVLAPRWQAVVRGSFPFANAPAYPVTDTSAAEARAASQIVQALPENTILFSEWYPLYTYYYTAQVEQQRFDLRFIEPMPHADTIGISRSMLEFIDKRVDTQPLFFTKTWPEIEQAGFRFQPTLIQFTPLYRLERR